MAQVVLQYVTLAVVVGGVVYYYGGFDQILTRTPQKPQTVKNELKEKTAKKKKTGNKPDGRVVSGTDSGSAKGRNKTTSNQAPDDMATASTTGRDQNLAPSGENDGNLSTKETRKFANDLAKAQLGTKFASGKQSSTKSQTRTVKQKFADDASPHASAATSSTGQDGDDETSLAASPAFNATTSEAFPDAKGVSDMLEPPSPAMSATTSEALPDRIIPDITGVGDMLGQAKEGPRTLKLVGDWQQAQSKKQKPAAKAPEPAETKKQRQQRRKREEEKERIAQSNKEHDAKRQQQMRGARIAEGTSNQTKADAFKAPASVWTAASNQSKDNAVKQSADNAVSTAPLDTFEPKPAEDATNDGAVTAQPVSQITNGQSTSNTVNGLKKRLGTQITSALSASERERAPETSNPLERTESWADMVDEEEQLRWAQEDPVEWESVVTKKDKKKARKGDGETNEDSAKRVNGQAQQQVANNKKNAISRQQAKSQAENRYGTLITEPTSNDGQEEIWEA